MFKIRIYFPYSQTIFIQDCIGNKMRLKVNSFQNEFDQKYLQIKQPNISNGFQQKLSQRVQV